jgi:FkbM family methyltransferase
VGGRLRRWLGLLRSLVLYWRPGRQRGLRHFYASFVDAGDLVFDVGAHLGDRTAAFSALGARVVALEPQPFLVPWLRRLVGGKEGVTVVQEAVGREEGRTRLWVSPATPTVSTVAQEWKDRLPEANPTFQGVRWNESVEVPVTTLDRLIRRYGTPGFCKIDVEGHEAEVLAGLGRALPALSVEFVAGGLEVAQACVRRLQELGTYEFNAVGGEERRFLLDGWVSGEAILGWLEAGAGDRSSGDLYARLAAGAGPEGSGPVARPAPADPRPDPERP